MDKNDVSDAVGLSSVKPRPPTAGRRAKPAPAERRASLDFNDAVTKFEAVADSIDKAQKSLTKQFVAMRARVDEMVDTLDDRSLEEQDVWAKAGPLEAQIRTEAQAGQQNIQDLLKLCKDTYLQQYPEDWAALTARKTKPTVTMPEAVECMSISRVFQKATNLTTQCIVLLARARRLMPAFQTCVDQVAASVLGKVDKKRGTGVRYGPIKAMDRVLDKLSQFILEANKHNWAKCLRELEGKSKEDVEKMSQDGGQWSKIVQAMTAATKDGRALAAAVTDFIRCTITCGTPAEAIRSEMALLEHRDFKLIRYKNKFDQPDGSIKEPQCLFLNLLFQDEMIVEVQITLPEFIEVKKHSHIVYELARRPPLKTNPEAWVQTPFVKPHKEVEVFNDATLDSMLHSAIGQRGVDDVRLKAEGWQQDQTMLVGFAMDGRDALVASLLRLGADVNRATGDGTTPLYMASQNGHLSVAQHLLASKAQVDLADEDGVTPVHMACYFGQLEVVKHLVQSKANIHTKDKQGDSPLSDAAAEGHSDIVEFLKAHGAKE